METERPWHNQAIHADAARLYALRFGYYDWCFTYGSRWPAGPVIVGVIRTSPNQTWQLTIPRVSNSLGLSDTIPPRNMIVGFPTRRVA